MKKYLSSIIICCIMMVTFTGCQKKVPDKDTATDSYNQHAKIESKDGNYTLSISAKKLDENQLELKYKYKNIDYLETLTIPVDALLVRCNGEIYESVYASEPEKASRGVEKEVVAVYDIADAKTIQVEFAKYKIIFKVEVK